MENVVQLKILVSHYNIASEAAEINCIWDDIHMLLASSDNQEMKKRAAIKKIKARWQVKIEKDGCREMIIWVEHKRVSYILLNCPDIALVQLVIEKFVEEHSDGADAWRRTSVLTFDGNTKLKSKVTHNASKKVIVKQCIIWVQWWGSSMQSCPILVDRVVHCIWKCCHLSAPYIY